MPRHKALRGPLADMEWIYNANRTEDLPIVQILRVENIGARYLRRVNDQGVPK
jgi:hypothetical protein